MEKNAGMFSSKTFISFRLKRMTWGWVNYQEKFFQKWTTPLTMLLI